MIRSRRLAFAAVVAVLGLAACGDPNTGTANIGTATTRPATKTPKVIELASGQTGSGGAIAAPAAATADRSSTANGAQTKLAIMPTKFVYDGALPALDTPAASWYFAPGQQPDQARLAKLAQLLGVTGDVRKLPDDQGGGWAVGPADYSGPVLTVGSDAMLSWSLSAAPTATIGIACAAPGVAVDPGSSGIGSSGGGVAIAPGVATVDAPPPNAQPPDATAPAAGDTVAPDCPQPQPPAGVPNKDEALAKAKDLFTSWGYNLDSYQFDDVFADQFSASVNASLTLDGMKAPIMLSVGFGENGAITYASGSLAEPQRGADYPTIGAAAGLERLKSQQAQVFGLDKGGVLNASNDVAPQPALGAPAIAPCEPNPAAACTAPTDAEPITVTLNSVKPDLTMVWASDNTIWLLPAYTFGSADGGNYTVMAVDDSFVKQADPAPVTIEPVGAPTTGVLVPNTASVAAGEPVTTIVP